MRVGRGNAGGESAYRHGDVAAAGGMGCIAIQQPPWHHKRQRGYVGIFCPSDRSRGISGWAFQGGRGVGGCRRVYNTGGQGLFE